MLPQVGSNVSRNTFLTLGRSVRSGQFRDCANRMIFARLFWLTPGRDISWIATWSAESMAKGANSRCGALAVPLAAATKGGGARQRQVGAVKLPGISALASRKIAAARGDVYYI